MNDVNELWSSAWRQLQKNLASGFAAGALGVADTLFASPVRGQAVPTGNSWLVRAQSRAVDSNRPLT
jgi:hypothetical protein